jgi:hypothetical protein
MDDIKAIDALEAARLFRFEPRARRQLFDFVHVAGPDVRDLTALTAAEFALAPLFAEARPLLPVAQPIPVDGNAAAAAELKADCMNILLCAPPSLTLVDVTAFSGDVAKLRLAGLSPDSAPTEIGDVARAVDELESRHRDSPSELSRRFGESGILRLQGFLWAVKLSLRTTDLRQAVSDAFEAFELNMPTTGRASAREPEPVY